VLVVELDIDDEKSIETAAQKLETDFGGLDILVNNAGKQILLQILKTTKKCYETSYF
jgi:NADP-dependent 3-hydroxy acid dehydrogenase YdfG